MSDIQDQVVEIVRGEDKSFVAFLSKKSNQQPFDLTGNTAIACKFKNADGSILSVAGTVVGGATLGNISVALTDSQTALLKVGTQNMDVYVDFNTTRRIGRGVSKLNVVDPSVT